MGEKQIKTKSKIAPISDKKVEIEICWPLWPL